MECVLDRNEYVDERSKRERERDREKSWKEGRKRELVKLTMEEVRAKS